jgi:hypothetical protein
MNLLLKMRKPWPKLSKSAQASALEKQKNTATPTFKKQIFGRRQNGGLILRHVEKGGVFPHIG